MIINYTGPQEMLPEIFYKLNTGAKNLTKYEVIASLWNDEVLYIDKNKSSKKMLTELNKYVIEKMENDGYVFEFIGKVTSEEKIYLFDYCESLGRIISQPKVIECSTLNYLFAKKNDTSIGFDILSLIFHDISAGKNKTTKLKVNLNKPEHINLIITKTTNPNEIYKLYKSVIDTTNKLNKILDEVLYKTELSNTYIQGYFAKYIFKYAYNKLYNINFSNGDFTINSVSFNLDNIKKNIHINILNDLFTDYWSKNRQLSDFHNLISNNINRYDTIHSKNEFLADFNTYHTDVLSTNITRYSTKEIKYDVKIITYYIHVFLMDTNMDYRFLYKNSKKIEYDHYYAKKWFGNSRTIPYSSIFNIYPIPSEDNKRKGAKDPSLTINTITVYNDALNKILHRPELHTNFQYFNDEEKKSYFNKFCKEYGRELDSIMGDLYDYLSNKNI